MILAVIVSLKGSAGDVRSNKDNGIDIEKSEGLKYGRYKRLC